MKWPQVVPCKFSLLFCLSFVLNGSAFSKDSHWVAPKLKSQVFSSVILKVFLKVPGMFSTPDFLKLSIFSAYPVDFWVFRLV